MTIRTTRLLVGCALLLMGGCATTRVPLHDESWMERLAEVGDVDAQTADGSLWVGGATTSHLFADRRAHQAGDVLTVYVVEEAKAKKSASTKTSRASEVDASVDAMLGLVTSVTQSNPNMGSSLQIGAGTDSTFDGSGETLREGALTTTLTVRVMDVLPNGHLIITGSRSLKVNNEVQILAMRGIVDPRDIQVDNTVLSTKIAEAQIEYFGQGVVSEKQHPGWLQRGLDWFWPF